MSDLSVNFFSAENRVKQSQNKIRLQSPMEKQVAPVLAPDNGATGLASKM